MLLQVSLHCRFVSRHQNAILLFGPKQYVGITRFQRNAIGIADTHNVQRRFSQRIVTSNGRPSRAAQVLVENESERHRLRCSHRLFRREAAAEFGHVRRRGSIRRLLSHVRVTLLDVSVTGGLVLQMKREIGRAHV